MQFARDCVSGLLIIPVSAFESINIDDGYNNKYEYDRLAENHSISSLDRCGLLPYNYADLPKVIKHQCDHNPFVHITQPPDTFTW